MIETPVPIEIPPGLFMNGTLKERAGRWADGNLVRFSEGIAAPIGGVSTLSTNVSPPSGGAPVSAYVWTEAAVNASFAAVAKRTKIYTIKQSTTGNLVVDITPASGVFDFGSSFTWSFVNLGGRLYMSRAGENIADSLFTWNPAVGGIATVVANSPGGSQVFTTSEGFLMLVSGKTVKWPSQDNVTVWTPAVTNSAGDLDIPAASDILAGRSVLKETLMWTSEDLWRLNYIGAPLYYGAEPAGGECGLLGTHCVSVVGGVARWMGPNGFFQYDGYVRELKCDVRDYVFGDIKRSMGHRFFTVSIPRHNEIQWWYLSSTATEVPDRYVSYNYANDTWSKGTMSRAAGASGWPSSSPGFGLAIESTPLMFDVDGTTVYVHENPASLPAGAYLESGPLPIGDGSRVMKIQKLIPDGAKTGSSADTITLKTTLGLDLSSMTATDYILGGSPAPVDVRLVGRYMQYKQTLNSVASRVGVPVIGVIPSGTR